MIIFTGLLAFVALYIVIFQPKMKREFLALCMNPDSWLATHFGHDPKYILERVKTGLSNFINSDK